MSITENASIEKIGQILKDAGSVLVFTHQNPDGDALGSSTALCKTLRNAGKDAFVLLEEGVPRYLQFMDTECCTNDRECITDPDVCICVDCSEHGRFETIKDKYDSGKIKICIDHHLNDTGFGDYYYIDSGSASVSELVFELIKTFDMEITKSVANAIYVGVSTDTGNFKYSNTTASTHKIAQELFEIGVDHNEIMVNLYQNIRIQEVEVRSKAVAAKIMLAGGKGAMACVTQKLLDECNAELGDAETVIDALRDIQGVEIAAVLKEKGDKVKVSFRAKSSANVAAIAMSFGGGGHVKAAGCTLDCDMDSAAKLIADAVEKALQ